MSNDSDIRNSVSSNSQPKTISVSSKLIANVLIIIVVAVLAFWGGAAYQKDHSKSTSTSASSGFYGSGNGFSRGAAGGFGTVSSVSATSITVASRDGTSKTYSITSSTTITDAGQSATASDIQTGDRVIVIPTSSTSTTAARILVNPSFGGPNGQPGYGGSNTAGGSSTNQ